MADNLPVQEWVAIVPADGRDYCGGWKIAGAPFLAPDTVAALTAARNAHGMTADVLTTDAADTFAGFAARKAR